MNKTNIAWVDLTRIIACFLVVLAHCCDPFVAQFDAAPSEFLSGTFLGSFCRPCVPIFVMISGVLLLPVKMDMGAFYRKRLSRVVIPLAVWSVVTPILFYLYINSGITTSNPNIVADSYTWSAALNKVYMFIFNFNYDLTPLWYIYMLVGLYLIIPIISAWLTQATQKDIKCFLWIWVFTTALPYIQMLAPALGYQGNAGNMGIWGVCDWNVYGTFYYFAGFLGYIVLAYYLVRFPLDWSWRKTLAIIIPIWAVGYAITTAGFITTQSHFPGNFPALEIVWNMSGINVVMMTFSVFVVMQKIPVRSSKLLSSLAALTFGVYLCHFLLVQISYDWIYPNLNIPAYIQIPVVAIIAFTISTCVVWVLSKLPFKKYIVG